MEEIAPDANDIIVTKPRYNAFLGTDLTFILKDIIYDFAGAFFPLIC